MSAFEGVSILVGMIVVSGFVLWDVSLLVKKDGTDAKGRPAGDPLILSRQTEALGELANLPQFLALKKGGVINLLSGDTLIPTESEPEPPYLALEGPHMGRGILFSTERALDKYVSLQRRMAQKLEEGA